MGRSAKKFVIAALAAVLLLTCAFNLRTTIGGSGGHTWEMDPASRSAADTLVNAPVRLPTDLDGQIVSLQEELRAHPDNGQAATVLGQAYLQKARETGDPSYYPKADALFNKAWKLDNHDFAAATGLGALALSRHEFSGGLEWGKRAHALNKDYPAAYAVMSDALVELGRYDEAVETIQEMVDHRPDLTSFARVSYIRELMGDVPGAVEAMERAAEAGSGRAENLAWAQAQLGNLAFNQGDLAGARVRYEESLRTLDSYVYGEAGLAKVAAAEGDYAGAIAQYQSAIRTMPLPEFVVALGDVYTVAGQPHAANEQYALVDAMTRLYTNNGVDTDVEMALFRADHDRDLGQALEQARAGYERRPSIKAADVLAWTLYKTGHFTEARTYSQEALKLGTKDSLMLFHAGMIESALGNHMIAAEYLRSAITINPYFSVRYAPVALSTLTQMTLPWS
jgi:tetratricopeptide (TPR) repeat protein